MGASLLLFLHVAFACRGFGKGQVALGWDDLVDQAAGSKNLNHPFQVVGHGSQTDFGLCSAETSQQEAGVSEDSVFQRAEGMLDSRSSQPHRCGTRYGRTAFHRPGY